MRNLLFDKADFGSRNLLSGTKYSLIKWVGGKKKLLRPIVDLIKKCYSKDIVYYEPFLGSGAVVFSCNFSKMVIGDKNRKLINFYESVKERPQELLENIIVLCNQFNNSINKLDFFKGIKVQFNLSTTEIIKQSSMFWFLNKAGFNGMYRENGSGEYNIPFSKTKFIQRPDFEDFLHVSSILKSKECILKCGDYQLTCSDIKAKDIVYLDPPYIPTSVTAGFTSYTNDDFVLKDHIVLKNFIEKISSEGAYVILSNSNAEKTIEIYGNMQGFKIMEVDVTRLISGKSKGRGKTKKLIIHNIS
jgi:DNA adenine methylase